MSLQSFINYLVSLSFSLPLFMHTPLSSLHLFYFFTKASLTLCIILAVVCGMNTKLISKGPNNED